MKVYKIEAKKAIDLCHGFIYSDIYVVFQCSGTMNKEAMLDFLKAKLELEGCEYEVIG